MKGAVEKELAEAPDTRIPYKNLLPKLASEGFTPWHAGRHTWCAHACCAYMATHAGHSSTGEAWPLKRWRHPVRA